MTKISEEITRAIIPMINLINRQEEENINALFQTIKHGDAAHIEWLAVELEKFFNVKLIRGES